MNPGAGEAQLTAVRPGSLLALPSGADVKAALTVQNRWVWAALHLCVFSLLALAFFEPLRPARPELDPSWGMALDHALATGKQFGTEIIFTYGPLGGFMGRTYAGMLFGAHFLWNVALSVGFGCVVLLLIRPLGWGRRALAVAYFVLLGSAELDLCFLLMIGALCVLLIRDAREKRPVQTAAAAVLLALLSLVKFTHVLFAVVGIFAAAGFDLWEGRRRRALAVAGLFFGGFACVWLLAGQHLANLPAYFSTCLELSRGYEDAMIFQERLAVFAVGAGALFVLALYETLVLCSMTDPARTLALGIPLGAGTFLAWKLGYARADVQHVFQFFVWTSFIAACFPVLLMDGRSRRRVKQAAVIVLALAALAGIYVAAPFRLAYCVDNAYARLCRSFAVVLHPARTAADLQARFSSEAALLDLPLLRQAAGNDTVDLLGFEQGLVVLNRLNYSPRPVFQSYCALTPRLAAMNAAFLSSDRAPEWLVLRLRTLDQRPPLLDEAVVQRQLLVRYEYAFTERGCLVWRKRRLALNPPAEPSLARAGRASLGERIDLTSLTGSAVWLECNWDWTFWARLRSFLYKPPVMHLTAIDNTGGRKVYRLPRLLAGGGFMVSPAVSDNDDFLKYATGQPLASVRLFSVDTDPEFRHLVKGPVSYRISVLEPPPLTTPRRLELAGKASGMP